jgi:cellulose synthase/poly-beta-1,6-N-acetylglucosamine synthase-like glycosyltransferase
LADKYPELSAKSGLSAGQRAGGWALLGGVLAALAIAPTMLLTLAVFFFAGYFGVIIVMRLCATIAAFVGKPPQPRSRLDDRFLPTLTILIAIYREPPDVVASLIKAIRSLDYPFEKLDVKLILEADDDGTIEAVRRQYPPANFELIPVPPSEPRTKPKALNLGLDRARGEIIAVFDAEDRPSPEQPREAVAAFQSGPRNLAVVQAPLAIHNGKSSWIARQFEVEYAILFNVWLPFLARLRLPLPLGGTSNYFRRDRLKAAGGWDAWNVTEDADLGMRLARFGGRAAMITSPTWEEAPVQYRHWAKQRTRWMKGHLQTWLVLMRDPLAAAREMGFANFASVQFTLGGALLTAIMHLPIIIWLLLGLVTPWVSLEGWHAVLFGAGYGGVMAAAIAAQRKTPAHVLATLPLYWPLLSWAMLKAFWEIQTRPHYWAKTPHGEAARKG